MKILDHRYFIGVIPGMEETREMNEYGFKLEEKRKTGEAIEFLANLKKTEPEVYELMCDDLWFDFDAPSEEEKKAVEEFLRKESEK